MNAILSCSFSFTSLTSGFSSLFRGQPADKAVFDSLIANLSAKLDAYEVILGKQKYLAGNVSTLALLSCPVFKIGPQEVTLADLFHLPYATMLSVAGTDIMTTKGPNVTRFVSDFPRGSTKLLNPSDGSMISRRARPGLQSRITLKVFPRIRAY